MTDPRPRKADAPEPAPPAAPDLRQLGGYIVRAVRPGRVIPVYVSAGSLRSAQRIADRLRRSTGADVTITAWGGA